MLELESGKIKSNKILILSIITILISLIGSVCNIVFKIYNLKLWILLMLIGITLGFLNEPLKNRKINKFESYLFFCGWTIIFYLGADFPVPIGFIIIVILTLLLTIIQSKYLNYLLPRIDKEKTFLKTVLFYSIGSLSLSVIITICVNFSGTVQTLSDMIIWSTLVTSVGAIYSICFWIFNKYLINKIFK